MVTKDEALKRIRECRDQVLRLQEIAPDAVPPFFKMLVANAEGIESKIEAEVKEKDEEAAAAFYLMIDIGIASMTKKLATFEADLRSRMQPEGKPRVKRKINQFKKRRGEW